MKRKASKPTKIKVDRDLLLINVLSVVLILAVALVPDSPLRIRWGFPSSYHSNVSWNDV